MIEMWKEDMPYDINEISLFGMQTYFNQTWRNVKNKLGLNCVKFRQSLASPLGKPVLTKQASNQFHYSQYA